MRYALTDAEWHLWVTRAVNSLAFAKLAAIRI